MRKLDYPCTLKHVAVEIFKTSEPLTARQVRALAVKEKGKLRIRPEKLKEELEEILKKKLEEGRKALGLEKE